jgi:hypothetical protein
VILRFGARDQNTENTRINYTERKEKPKEVVAGSYFEE